MAHRYLSRPWRSANREALFVIGLAYALWMRFTKPVVYAEIGGTVMEDSHERAEEEPAAPPS